MSGVRANWFVDLGGVDAALAEGDPLGPALPRMQEVGVKIDLRDPDLSGKLAGLLEQESALFNIGVICPIKDDPQSCCSACPVRHTDALESLTPLCRIGVSQEFILTSSAIHRAESDR